MSALTIPYRPDMLPEHANYRDTGCDLHASCLTCPFERCRYEVPLAVQVGAEKARKVRELRETGRKINDIAAEVGVSRRQVFRMLRTDGGSW